DDGRDGLRLGELGVRRLAEAEVTDQALLLELGQGTERLGDGLPAGAVGPEPQVNGVEASTPRWARFSWTWALRSAGSCEGRQLPSWPRRAPTLVTMRRSAGYGWSASRL